MTWMEVQLDIAQLYGSCLSTGGTALTVEKAPVSNTGAAEAQCPSPA